MQSHISYINWYKGTYKNPSWILQMRSVSTKLHNADWFECLIDTPYIVEHMIHTVNDKFLLIKQGNERWRTIKAERCYLPFKIIYLRFYDWWMWGNEMCARYFSTKSIFRASSWFHNRWITCDNIKRNIKKYW